MVPPPPVAGTVEAGLSTVTAHLDRLEGEVIVFPEDPHPAIPIAQANSAVIAEKLRSCVVAIRLRIARTAVVAAGKSQCFQDAYQLRLCHISVVWSPAGTRR